MKQYNENFFGSSCTQPNYSQNEKRVIGFNYFLFTFWFYPF